MTRLALVLCGFLIYFIQAQLLPAIFHTNWLPNLILTIIVMVTLFKGRYAAGKQSPYPYL